jgi:hypothetical protein
MVLHALGQMTADGPRDEIAHLRRSREIVERATKGSLGHELLARAGFGRHEHVSSCGAIFASCESIRRTASDPTDQTPERARVEHGDLLAPVVPHGQPGLPAAQAHVARDVYGVLVVDANMRGSSRSQCPPAEECKAPRRRVRAYRSERLFPARAPRASHRFTSTSSSAFIVVSLRMLASPP